MNWMVAPVKAQLKLQSKVRYQHVVFNNKIHSFLVLSSCVVSHQCRLGDLSLLITTELMICQRQVIDNIVYLYCLHLFHRSKP